VAATGVGAVFVCIGVAVPVVTALGGRPLFLAGGREALGWSSAFLLFTIIPALAAVVGSDLGLDLASAFLSVSPPDLEVCDAVSSSEELDELSESELSDSELLDSILLCFFLDFSSSDFFGGSTGLPGAFFT